MLQASQALNLSLNGEEKRGCPEIIEGERLLLLASKFHKNHDLNIALFIYITLNENICIHDGFLNCIIRKSRKRRLVCNNKRYC